MSKHSTTCRNCEGSNLRWHCDVVKTNPSVTPVDGRLRLSDVSCTFFLGCEDCSETVGRMTADEAMSRLNTRHAASGLADGAGWVRCSERKPERDQDPYYGDDYSVPVLLNVKSKALYRWSFRHDGWIEAGWRDGYRPEDYEDWGLEKATHWHALIPSPPAAGG